jgi:hypothetical protein
MWQSIYADLPVAQLNRVKRKAAQAKSELPDRLGEYRSLYLWRPLRASFACMERKPDSHSSNDRGNDGIGEKVAHGFLPPKTVAPGRLKIGKTAVLVWPNGLAAGLVRT